jgi:competence ComEA-like helix-hairpin-helix protein
MNTNDKHYVSKRNRQGIYALICISLFIVFIPRLYDWFSPEPVIVIESEKIEQLKSEYQKNQTRVQSTYQRRSKYRVPPSSFDPNDYSLKQWMYLGLSEKQAAVVLRFTARGIRSDEDLSRIFVIPSALFERIKDSTYYSLVRSDYEKDKSNSEKKSTTVLVEVNHATQEQLETIPGVGSFYAKNIIRYRERLGGFIRKEQLLEVWKMDEAKYTEIVNYISIDANGLRKIKLNTVTAEELKAHPYLNWNIANSLIKIRERLGGYKSIEEIKESILVNEELFNKLKPYVSL